MNSNPGERPTESGAGTMRAARLHGIRDLRLETLPRPVPGPGEVLLKVAAVGVCGSDVHYYLEGRIGSQVVTGPIIMGHEFSAWVAELGEGVTGLELGQLVAVEAGDPLRRLRAVPAGPPQPVPQRALLRHTAGRWGVCRVHRHAGGELLPPARGHGARRRRHAGAAGHRHPHRGPGPPEGRRHRGRVGRRAHRPADRGGGPGGRGQRGLYDRAAGLPPTSSPWSMSPTLRWTQQNAISYAEILRLTGGRGVDVAFEAAGAPETPQQAASVTRIGGKVIIAGIPSEDVMTFSA